ncbi:MAG: OmpA family protein [Terrimicrobiaceae bacterium]|nr:OmpA family protein [Terrimicrobiaceae bacterium]
MKQPFLLALTICTALSLSSCALFKKKGGDTAGADGDYVTGTPLPDRVEGANFFGGTVDRKQFQPVYFSYDSFTVSDSELAKLDPVAGAMKGMPNDIIIAGFTDDRGTEEYNRGLGERRAQAVREALIGMGVAASRIQTVSFGEEMPADTGSSEESYAKNRRAEFGVVKK